MKVNNIMLASQSMNSTSLAAMRAWFDKIDMRCKTWQGTVTQGSLNPIAFVHQLTRRISEEPETLAADQGRTRIRPVC